MAMNENRPDWCGMVIGGAYKNEYCAFTCRALLIPHKWSSIACWRCRIQLLFTET